MKIVKLEWMNDERKDVIVRVLDLRYDPTTGKGDSFTTLSPCEIKEFDIYMPDSAILYVKKWPNMVMLSYREQSVPEQDVPPVELPHGVVGALRDFSQV